jgi:hypothetical protein
VSAWLASAHGVAISHKGLANHKAEHLGVAEAVRERSLEAASGPFEAAVQTKLTSIASVDRQIRRTGRLLRKLSKELERALDADPSTLSDQELARYTVVFSKTTVSLYSALLREHRSYLAAREDLLSEKKGGKGEGGDVAEQLKKGLANLLALGFAPSNGPSPPAAAEVGERS